MRNKVLYFIPLFIFFQFLSSYNFLQGLFVVTVLRVKTYQGILSEEKDILVFCLDAVIDKTLSCPSLGKVRMHFSFMSSSITLG